MMAEELHVSSVVVHGRPERLEAIQAGLAGLSGVEVHAAAPSGKLVVTLETTSEQEIVAHLATISRLDGVLSATLVFHQVEPITGRG
jgi:nitrate reductase NapD